MNRLICMALGAFYTARSFLRSGNTYPIDGCDYEEQGDGRIICARCGREVQ